MISHEIEIILIASFTAVACALPGVFLVLRRVSLMSDAISHAILLGIVLAFFYTKNLSSPLLIIGAALMGIITVVLTEIIIKTRKLKEDAAIGLVFPLLFSLGVILLNKYAGTVHLDTACVLFGELAFAPFNRLIINGMDLGPQSLWVLSAMLIINSVFIWAFYKELKITTFDSDLAYSLGFKPAVLNYALMTIVSITAVAAFESVGSILVVAMMIVPAVTAFLLTEQLSKMILISAAVGVLSAIGGYGLAYKLDSNIAGSMATFTGILFTIVLIFAPHKGLLAKFFIREWQKWDLAVETLLIHLLHTEAIKADKTEQIVSHMKSHMSWDEVYTNEVIARCLQDEFILKDEEYLTLTDLGREKAKVSISKD